MDATQALTLIIVAVIVRDGLLGWALINWVIRASTPAVPVVPVPGTPPGPGTPPVVVPPPVVIPPPAPPSPRFKGMATSFGGPSDPEESAYGGMVNGNALGVSLPARVSGSPTVRVFWNSKTADCPVVDVGPHFTTDNYWVTGAAPKAQSLTGQNKAIIDLTPATWAALGATGNLDLVEEDGVSWDFVSYLDATAPTGPTPPVQPPAPTAGTPPWVTLGRTFNGLVWNSGPMPAQIQAWMDNIATRFPNQAPYVRALKTIGAKGYWEWCGGFVASMLSYSGIPGPISPAGLQGQTTIDDWAYVDAWRTWGTKVWDANDGTDINDAQVQTGDVLIWKTSSIHHVSFHDHPEPDSNDFASLGGDQGSPLRVCIEDLPMSWCVAIRRPPASGA